MLPGIIRNSFCSLIFALAGVCFGVHDAKAQNARPGFELISLDPVTPQEAEAYFDALREAAEAASRGVETPAFAASAAGQIVPDIAELARALRNNIDLIYQYVYNEIELTPTYGLAKGALGTLLDGSGNPFDQTNLFIKLAQAAGFEAEFVYGTLRLTAGEANAWLGTQGGIAVAGNVLANGGIPAESAGADLEFDHVWAQVQIGQTWYTFDPSLKTHEVKTRLADFNSVLGYKKFGGCAGGVSDPNCGLFGAAGGTLNGNRISGINNLRLGEKLDVYAANLIAHIRSNDPAAAMTDIVGGLSIIPTGETQMPVIGHSNLAPNTTPTIGNNTVDDVYRTKLSLKNGSVCTVSPDTELYADQIDAQRLTISMTDASNAELRLDGSLIVTWTVPVGAMTLYACVDHPYASSGGDQNNITMSLDTTAGNSFAVLNGWGATGSGRLAYHKNRLQKYQVDDGLTSADEAVIGETLQINAVNWLLQTSRQRQIVNGLFDRFQVTLHDIGVAGQTTAPYVDIPGSFGGLSSRTGESLNLATELLSSTGISSAFESTTIGQATNGNGISTVTLFGENNGSAGSGAFYEFASVEAFDQDRATLAANGWSNQQLDSIRATLLAGSGGLDFKFYLPEDGAITRGQWTGYTYISLGANASGTSAASGYIIGGGLKGAFADGDQTPQETVHQAEENATNLSKALDLAKTVGNLISDPVNTFTGDYVYDATDLTVGSRTFPFGLGLTRSYSSGSRLLDGPFGYGWSHNLDLRASVYSNSLQGMGEDSPIDAAAMIVTLYLSKQLYSADPTLKEVIVATLLQDWGTQHLFDNVVTVSIPGASETFVKLPGNLGFNPPNRSNAKLTEPGPGEFEYRTLDATTLSFGSDGKISAWQNANGFDVSFVYNASERLTRVENEFGWKLEFLYNNAGRIKTVSDTLGRSVSFAYQADGDLKLFTDAEGNTTEYFYDQRGRMERIRYPSFPNTNFIKNTYDSLGRIREQTNPSTGTGNPYQYFIAGTRSEEVDPYGNSRVWYQDDRGNVVKTTDKLHSLEGGRETVSEYDGLDRLIKRTLPEGNSTSFTYDDATCATRCTHNVKTITRVPDAARGGDTLTESFTYWGAGKKFKQRNYTNPRSQETTFDYDTNGNLLTRTEPVVSGQTPVTTFEYYPSGRRTGMLRKTTDPTGLINEFVVDGPTGNLLETKVDPAGLNLQSILTYDAWGNIRTITDPEGRTTTTYYDCARRPRGTVPPAPGPGIPILPRTKLNYDKDGRVRFSRLVSSGINGLNCNATGGGTGGTVLQEYESQYYNNGLLKAEISPDGATNSYDYDRLDRLVLTTDPDGREYRTIYDAVSQVIRTRTAMGVEQQVTARYEYNRNGSNTAIRDARDNRTEFLYNGLDRLIETHYPSLTMANTANPNDKDVLRYNKNGSVNRVTTRAGQNIVMTYDALERMTSRAPPDSQKVQYQYDLAGRQTQVKYETGAAHIIAYGYDSAGRLTSVTDDGRMVSYLLDAVGSRTQMTWPDGISVNYDYDNAGRIRAIRQGTVATPGTALASYTYDALSRRAGQKLWTNGSALTTTYTYEPDSALDTMTHSLADTADDVTYTLNYLPGNQIDTMTVSNPAYVYESPANLNYSYKRNRLNQITEVDQGGGAVFVLGYDANGNLTSDGGSWIYGYDSQNRMTSATGPNTSAAYGYDPLGRRSSKTVTGATNEDRQFLYDGADVIADLDATGAVVRRFIHGPGVDEPVAMYIGSGATARRFYVTDPQGSVIGLTGGSGVLRARHSYSGFGIPDDGAVVAQNPYRYTARRWDAETGLYYYRARYYSPTLGRFMSPDPIGYEDGLNFYAYVGNDPVNFVDPSGLGAAKALEATVGPNTHTGYYLIEPIAIAADYISSETILGDPGAWASIQGLGPQGALLGGAGKAVSAGLRFVGSYGKGSRTAAIAAKNRGIGFTSDTVDTAFSGMREGHAIRHLQGDLIPGTGSLQSRVTAFKDLAAPILTNPTKTAPWRVGVTDGRAFLGNVNGKNVVIVVAKDGPKQGKVITSFVPDANQLSIINSR